jgi:hypothetical protein
MIVKIYLRSIVKDGINSLALFDSNRSGDINNLITDVKAGATVIWKLDSCSGIKSITRIYSKEEKHTLFKSEPAKRMLCKEFKLRLEKGSEKVKVEIKEKYTIECLLCNNKELIIDPYLRIPPPPSK